MFVKDGLVRDSQTMQQLLEFTSEVAEHYFDNPYHSFYHAIDMTYMTYYLLHDMGIREQLDLTSADVAALLLAAIAHDVLHPGTNNLFQVNSSTPVAKLYHNQSVLENQSMHYVLDLLTTKYTFLESFHFEDLQASNTPHQEIIVRIIDTISDAILKTDMAFHFSLLEQVATLADSYAEQMTTGSPSLSYSSTMHSINSPSNRNTEPDLIRKSFMRLLSEASPGDSREAAFKAKLLENPAPLATMASDASIESLPKIPVKDPKLKQTLVNAVLHAADISNPARPFALSMRWSDQVIQEFFNQGDLERDNDLPRSPNMDRDSTQQVQVQIAFTDFIVRPFFESLAELFPRMVSFTDILRENARHLDDLAPAPSSSEPVAEEDEEANLETDDVFDEGSPKLMGRGSVTGSVSSPSNHISKSRVASIQSNTSSGGGRRLSMAAGTVEIPETLDKLFLKLKARRNSQTAASSNSINAGSISGSASVSASANLFGSNRFAQSMSSTGSFRAAIKPDIATPGHAAKPHATPSSKSYNSLRAMGGDNGGPPPSKRAAKAPTEESLVSEPETEQDAIEEAPESVVYDLTEQAEEAEPQPSPTRKTRMRSLYDV
eukprot:jgi/Hompol1/1155/HPOL_001331-RA